MKLTKDRLEALYATMSLTELAAHLNMAKSTLYYHMRKLGVERRSKSEAQNKHLESGHHQRLGKAHSLESRSKISKRTQAFWDSDRGNKQKEKLASIRKDEWNKRSSKQRHSILNRLQEAARPKPGELSKFGTKLHEFLSARMRVSSGIRLIKSHVSDIILVDDKIVIELVLPIEIYGAEQAMRLEKRYSKIMSELNALGYRVVVIEDQSNSISHARCQRIYDQLVEFINTQELNIKIIS